MSNKFDGVDHPEIIGHNRSRIENESDKERVWD